MIIKTFTSFFFHNYHGKQIKHYLYDYLLDPKLLRYNQVQNPVTKKLLHPKINKRTILCIIGPANGQKYYLSL